MSIKMSKQILKMSMLIEIHKKFLEKKKQKYIYKLINKHFTIFIQIKKFIIYKRIFLYL